jgi:hypothetical protein
VVAWGLLSTARDFVESRGARSRVACYVLAIAGVLSLLSPALLLGDLT